MTPPESKTHKIAVLKQDNGELQEDVVHRTLVESDTDDDEVTGEDPADDDQPADDASSGSDRVVDSMPVEDVEGRPDPGSPIPGTLPRPPRP